MAPLFRPVYLGLSVALFLVQVALTYILIYCVVWARATRSMTHTDKLLCMFCQIICVILFLIFWLIKKTLFNHTTPKDAQNQH